MNWVSNLYMLLFGYSLGLVILPIVSPALRFNNFTTYIVIIGGAISAVIWFMLYYNRKFD